MTEQHPGSGGKIYPLALNDPNRGGVPLTGYYGLHFTIPPLASLEDWGSRAIESPEIGLTVQVDDQEFNLSNLGYAAYGILSAGIVRSLASMSMLSDQGALGAELSMPAKVREFSEMTTERMEKRGETVFRAANAVLGVELGGVNYLSHAETVWDVKYATVQALRSGEGELYRSQCLTDRPLSIVGFPQEPGKAFALGQDSHAYPASKVQSLSFTMDSRCGTSRTVSMSVHCDAPSLVSRSQPRLLCLPSRRV